MVLLWLLGVLLRMLVLRLMLLVVLRLLLRVLGVLGRWLCVLLDGLFRLLLLLPLPLEEPHAVHLSLDAISRAALLGYQVETLSPSGPG